MNRFEARTFTLALALGVSSWLALATIFFIGWATHNDGQASPIVVPLLLVFFGCILTSVGCGIFAIASPITPSRKLVTAAVVLIDALVCVVYVEVTRGVPIDQIPHDLLRQLLGDFRR